ncbi:hypothetical protein QCA50_017520 [Cerrena zonata]|uniref:Uncharacterized protein n=1 Tax=Cerrena zonata TaxID=2478898 RepID=A0AAW0FFE0_9APHY
MSPVDTRPGLRLSCYPERSDGVFSLSTHVRVVENTIRFRYPSSVKMTNTPPFMVQNIKSRSSGMLSD